MLTQPIGAGYGVVCGIGLFFSAFMLGLTWIQARYTAFKPSNSEGERISSNLPIRSVHLIQKLLADPTRLEFTSASRSVKPGLIASGIVSAWT
jgi:hypothetical protein